MLLRLASRSWLWRPHQRRSSLRPLPPALPWLSLGQRQRRQGTTILGPATPLQHLRQAMVAWPRRQARLLTLATPLGLDILLLERTTPARAQALTLATLHPALLATLHLLHLAHTVLHRPLHQVERMPALARLGPLQAQAMHLRRLQAQQLHLPLVAVLVAAAQPCLCPTAPLTPGRRLQHTGPTAALCSWCLLPVLLLEATLLQVLAAETRWPARTACPRSCKCDCCQSLAAVSATLAVASALAVPLPLPPPLPLWMRSESRLRGAWRGPVAVTLIGLSTVNIRRQPPATLG